jgi:hypothetical protein
MTPIVAFHNGQVSAWGLFFNPEITWGFLADGLLLYTYHAGVFYMQHVDIVWNILNRNET